MKNTAKNLHTVWAQGFGPPYMSCCYNTVFCLKRIIDFQRMSTYAPSHVVTSTMGIFTQFTIVSFVQQVLNLKTDFPVCSGFLLGVQLICMLNRALKIFECMCQTGWGQGQRGSLLPPLCAVSILQKAKQGEKRFMGQSDCPSSANAKTFVAQNYKNKTLLCTLQTSSAI